MRPLPAPELIGLAALLIVAGGCGLHYWSRPGGTLEEFNRDSAACAKDSSPAYGVIVNEAYRMCLTGKGWQRAQKQEPVPPGWYRGIE